MAAAVSDRQTDDEWTIARPLERHSMVTQARKRT